MSTHGQNQGQERVLIRQLPSGVPGLDEILGGGLPEYSFNIIAGAPGCGKTTLAHQFIFANANPEQPALYFTVLGESAIKMLRYQQQFSFFDQSKMDGSIRFVNLSHLVLDKDLGAVLAEIIKEVEASNARIVVVDSFRTVVRNASTNASEIELQGFLQRMALHLTSWQATTFLIGEYVEGELRDNPVFTVADGLFWLYRMIAALTRLGVTIMTTVEVDESFTSMNLSNFTVSFLADDILRLRYVSINGQLRKMLLAVKMRRSEHSIDMVEYQITSRGVVIGEPLRGYRGLTSGIPGPWSFESGQVPRLHAAAEGDHPNG